MLCERLHFFTKPLILRRYNHYYSLHRNLHSGRKNSFLSTVLVVTCHLTRKEYSFLNNHNLKEISRAGTSGQKRVKISDKQPYYLNQLLIYREVRIIDDPSLYLIFHPFFIVEKIIQMQINLSNMMILLILMIKKKKPK